MVLKNGEDELSLEENGAFTFEDKLLFSENYDVEVDTQSSGQTCVVSGGSGTTELEDVSNVRVVCTSNAALLKLWTHPASLSDNFSPNGENAQLPNVATDSDGNMIIVWIQGDGANSQVFKSEYR